MVREGVESLLPLLQMHGRGEKVSDRSLSSPPHQLDRPIHPLKDSVRKGDQSEEAVAWVPRLCQLGLLKIGRDLRERGGRPPRASRERERGERSAGKKAF